MRLKVDRENDAVYLRLSEGKIIESEEVQPGVILDFDAEGRVIGLELLGFAKRISPDILQTVQLETA
ncbi:MAG: DUF2283 domain-containing protein [Armatimonadia bacterium]